MAGFHPGQLSFLLWATFDTLPIKVNLRWWCIQSNVRCSLCSFSRCTTAWFFGGCSLSLAQQCYTYRHDQILHLLASRLADMFVCNSYIHVYSDLPGLRASEHNDTTRSVDHLLQVRHCCSQFWGIHVCLSLCVILKQLDLGSKAKYFYETVEISVLGYYQSSCVQIFKQFVDFIQPSMTTKSLIHQIIDDTAKTCISCSQTISLARNCGEWACKTIFLVLYWVSIPFS